MIFKRINVDAQDITEKFLESILTIAVNLLKFVAFVFCLGIWGIAVVGFTYFYLGGL